MRKRLYCTLLMMCVAAMITSQSGAALNVPDLYVSDANAVQTPPLIVKKLPDVYIGDREDWLTAGLTIDINWFRFPDAFDLDEYVQDKDTTKSLLAWSFWEGGNGYLKVNGMMELSDPSEALDPAAVGKDIRHPSDPAYQPGNYVDFWDLKDSPEGLGPPWPDPLDPLDEVVTFFVSDGVGVDSDQIFVKAEDDGFDRISPVKSYTFEPDPEGWIFEGPSASTPDASFTGAFSAYNGQMLGVTTDDLTNRFGYWRAPEEVEFDQNFLYKLSWDVGTDQSDPNRVPTMRFRINETTHAYAVMMIVQTPKSYNPYAPPFGMTKEYPMYLMPLTDGGLTPAFDVYDFTPYDSGTIWLNDLTIEPLVLPESGWTSDTVPVFTEWNLNDMVGPFTPVTGSTNAGLDLSSPVSESYAFGYWYSPATIPFVDDQLYRAVFSIASSDVAPPNGMVRVISEDYQVAYRVRWYPDTAPGAVPGEYPVYFETHDYIPALNHFEIAFEIADFEFDRGGTITLSDVVVEHHDLLEP